MAFISTSKKLQPTSQNNQTSSKKRKRLEKKNQRKQKTLQKAHQTTNVKEMPAKKRRIEERKISIEEFENNASDSDIESDLDDDAPLDADDTMIRVDRDLIKKVRTRAPDDDPDDPDMIMIRKMEKLLGLNRKRKKKEQMEKEAQEVQGITLKDYVQEKREQRRRQMLEAEEEQQEEEDEEDALDQELDLYDDLDNFLTSNLGVDSDEEEHMLARFTGQAPPDNTNPKAEMQDDASESSEASDDASESSEDQPELTKAESSTPKYLPPHLRRKQMMEDDKKSADYLELEQQMRSICNRLSHTNIVQLTLDTLQIYKNSSKNYFNEILANIIIRSLMDDVVMLGQFIVVYAGYVIAIHNIGDMEVGARFLETLIQKFEECRRGANRKATMNMTMFFAHLYNMSLFSSDFIFDMVAQLVDACEKEPDCDLTLHVELTYKLLLTCGVLLRKNDQSKFRRLIHNVQQKFESLLEAHPHETMKAKTFIDLIGEVYSQSKREDQQEEYAKYQLLRKAIYKLQQKMNVHGDMTLNVSYSDLRDSSVKGRWWMVGTAWSGHNAEGGSTLKTSESAAHKLTAAPTTVEDKKKAMLKKLAIKQKMTTALRVDIFCAVMGADDVEGAVKNLMPLNIIQNDREIARVIVHCCCQEKRFNKFYADLVERLCSFKNFARAMQFVFYERFKDLDVYEMRHVVNMCSLLAALLGNGSLRLSMLKVVEFGELSGKSLIFFRFLFVNLFLDLSVEECGKIFFQAAKNPKLSDFKDELKLFLVPFRNKESRRSFLPEFLAIRDIKRKDDAAHLKKEEKVLKGCTKKMLRVLSYEPQMFETEEG